MLNISMCIAGMTEKLLQHVATMKGYILIKWVLVSCLNMHCVYHFLYFLPLVFFKKSLFSPFELKRTLCSLGLPNLKMA